MSDVLHFAFEYFDRGWSIIPLVGKRPPKNFGWKRFQTERATLDDVKRWFTPSCDGFTNIGIVTGAVSGITVVDCDTPNDTKWWRENYPATPLASRTGRGGAHLFYRASPILPIGNRANILGRDIDIRGDGGYVCAPPSVHPDTDVDYEWQFWNHYALDEIPFFDPAWLGETSSPAAPANKHRCFAFDGEAPRVRSINDVLRQHPQSRRVRRLVSRLNRAKTDRSKRDYAIVCELIRVGLCELDIWSLVHQKSKFATNGWQYFVLTYRNALQDATVKRQ
ncbi:MAG: bifunctional DNA primase/polymerase [Pirellulaceae bacterium]